MLNVQHNDSSNKSLKKGNMTLTGTQAKYKYVNVAF